MGNRLTKIYTRTGDAGETGTADGKRLSKADRLMDAQGDVDELNSFIGLLACKIDDAELKQLIRRIQHDLFNLGGELSLSQPLITAEDIVFLEKQLDAYNAELPPLQEFILPGGGEVAALCHVSRAVCRRAERSLVALHNEKALSPDLLAYVNRLSDLLFVLARVLTRLEGENEVYWRKREQ